MKLTKNLLRIVSIIIVIQMMTSNYSKAQFIQGYGIAIGGTYSNQRFQFKNISATETKFFHIGTNAAVFFEMGDYYNIRWISEIMYNRKGAMDEFRLDIKKNNEITYISWNNYAKFRKELDNTTPYAIIGGRLEYKMGVIDGGYTDTEGVHNSNFATIHACISGGVGMEFFIHSSVIPFLEVQYFTDLPLPMFEAYVNERDAYKNLHVRNIGIEVRLGFKFLFHGGTSDKCPPVYVSPGAY